MKWKIVLLFTFAMSLAVGGAQATTSSKSTFQSAHMCRDKLIPKGLKGKEYKDEKAKCLADPGGYQ